MKSTPFKPSLLIIGTMFLMMAYTSLSAQSQLDAYVQQGLKSNLVLQQKNLSLEQAQHSLQIAKSYFLPSVNLLGDYTSGDGGRSIAIPIGDLLNPVYASLNEMTGSDAFPQVKNVEQNFFPKNFYDVRVRTSMPLVNTDLYLNRSIESQKLTLQQHEVEVYKRQLVLDIKSAFYNYQSAIAAVRIYEAAMVLVDKNVEINESLLRNGKALPANLLRSKSEVEKVKAELASAKNQQVNAQKYFNFLLNRPLDTTIDVSESSSDVVLAPDSANVKQREEIQMIRTVREINESSLLMSRLSRLPKLNAFMDLGSQESNWQVNSHSRYYLVGVQFTMPLFQGFRNNNIISQNKLALQKTELNLKSTTQQLELSASVAQNNLRTTIENYHAAQERLKASQSYFNLIDKGYQQGVNTLIEFLDARNQLTASQLQQNLRLYEMLTAAAQVERETASYPLNNN
jgi:outer membrane protein TolC